MERDGPHEALLFVGARLVVLGTRGSRMGPDETDAVTAAVGVRGRRRWRRRHGHPTGRRRRLPLLTVDVDGFDAFDVRRMGAQEADPAAEAPEEDDDEQDEDGAQTRQPDDDRAGREAAAAAQQVVVERVQGRVADYRR